MNEACDYAINPLLLDAGLRLPEGALVDRHFCGVSAEEIYNQLTWESKPPATPNDDGPSGSNNQDGGDAAGVGPTSPISKGGIGVCPCIEWLEAHHIQPQTLVFLTDLYGNFPFSAPAYPVLWASTGGRQAPFGEVIPMQAA